MEKEDASLEHNAIEKRKTKSKSRNSRSSTNKMREKFGVVVLNTVKEVLLLDKINGDSKCRDAIKKVMMELEKLNVWKCYPPGHRMGSEFQKAPLRMIFDVKKEDFRYKSRHVVGGRKIDSSHVESFSSVVQSMSIRMMLTIAEPHDSKSKCFSSCPSFRKITCSRWGSIG